MPVSVVLLLAHNWDDLSRGARAGVLVTLLLAAQALAGYAGVRRWGSILWREASGALQVAGVACAVALVAQTYHYPGNEASFYRTVLLLTIPLVYLLDSAAVSALTWAGLLALATTWRPREPEYDAMPRISRCPSSKCRLVRSFSSDPASALRWMALWHREHQL